MKTSTLYSNNSVGYTRSSVCRICGDARLQEVISLGYHPLANSLTKNVDEFAATAPLELVRCESCGSIQLSVDIDANAMFSQYLWVTATSPSTVSHCEWLVEQTLNRALHMPSSVLEVASNDGTLLKLFKMRGLDPLGIDPAENLAEIANREGIPTLPNFFSKELAEDLLSSRDHFDVVVARNVLSHVPDPGNLIHGISKALSKNGIAVIEFHRVDIILDELHYDSIYHEHSLYHSLFSMSVLLKKARLQIFDVLPSPISGGSWILFASHQSQHRSISLALTEALTAETQTKLETAEPWGVFAKRVVSHKHEILEFLEAEAREGRTVVGFGASARSATLLNYWFGDTAAPISAIIDSNPWKQGLFSPGVGVPILSLKDGLALKPDTILILAFNFDEEIRALLRDAGWTGTLAYALPRELRVEEFKG